MIRNLQTKYLKQLSFNMKYLIVCLLLSLSFIMFGQPVVIVVHKDLLIQLAKNEAVKTANHVSYDYFLNRIRTYKNSVSTSVASIAVIQQTTFDALTNVSDGIKNIKTIKYISQYALSTLNNVGTALELAAGKPYLVEIVSKDAIIIYERVGNLTTFVKKFVLNAQEDQLVKPTERDRILYSIYHQMLVLDALTSSLCFKLRKYKLEDAVYHIIPIDQWINTDERLIKKILRGWKY